VSWCGVVREASWQTFVCCSAFATGQVLYERWFGGDSFRNVIILFDLYNWRRRLQFRRGVLFPTPAYLRRRYRPRPPWLWPLCYAWRWLDAGRDAMETLFRRGKTI
jgi:hypothetical protein